MMKKHGPFLLILALVVLVVDVATLGGFFQSDDISEVMQSQTRGWADWAAFFKTHWFDLVYYYRPLLQWTFAWDRMIWDLNPFGYRLTNAFIYLLGCWATYFVALTFFKNRQTAFLTALTFTVLPTHYSPLFWISDRGTSLAGFFLFTAFGLYVSYIEKKKVLLYVLCCVSFFLGAITKESALSLPLLLILYEAYRLWDKQKWEIRKPLERLLPIFVVTCCYLLLRRGVLGDWYLSNAVYQASLLGQLKNMATYILFNLFPPEIHTKLLIKNNLILTGLLMMGLTLSLAWAAVKEKNKMFVFFVLFMVVAILPFVQAFYVWNNYIPSFGFCLAWMAWVVKGKPWRKNLLIGFQCVYLVFFLWIAQSWRGAGQLTRTLNQQGAEILKNLDGKDILVLAIPGMYREGIVYNYCYGWGIELFYPSLQGKATQMAEAVLSEKEEAVEYERISDQRVSVRLTHPRSYFVFTQVGGYYHGQGPPSIGLALAPSGIPVEITGLNAQGKANAFVADLSGVDFQKTALVGFNQGNLFSLN